jgi:hypothetical protein
MSKSRRPARGLARIETRWVGGGGRPGLGDGLVRVARFVGEAVIWWGRRVRHASESGDDVVEATGPAQFGQVEVSLVVAVKQLISDN